jgi:hypothetical protein
MSRSRTNLNRVRVESVRRKTLNPPVAGEARRLHLASVVAAEPVPQPDRVPTLAAVGPNPDF